MIWRLGIGVLALMLNALILPRILCDPPAHRLWSGDRDAQVALADTVARYVQASPDPIYYHTGLLRFDGQSAVAIDQMALLGLGQVVTRHPELAERYLPAMHAAADHLADRRQLTYAAHAYGSSGLVRLDPGEGHAYLGYHALGLGMLRRIEPQMPHAALHDRLIRDLSRRLFASSTGLIETYPGELWPPDVSAVAGAIGLHASATGAQRPAALDRWAERFVRCSVHADSGMLRQRVYACGQGKPRGSGTALAAYFLSFSNPELSLRLHQSLAQGAERSLLGFSALREHPVGFSGRGDVDSGPVIAGVSIGATGFGLGAARVAGDRGLFVRLHRTTRLFGVSMPHGGERGFAVGGALGNALLLAMLTAEEIP
ncbi:MAG TPA: hypothetical protein ENK18_07200 [Deltaproteobacteria bacterium]|nr:hypothetical protein [Deltaproteobacteria bacterium]